MGFSKEVLSGFMYQKDESGWSGETQSAESEARFSRNLAREVVAQIELNVTEIIDPQHALQLPKIEVKPAPEGQNSDLGFACFALAKILRQSPQQIAAVLVAALNSSNKGQFITHYEATGAYVNAYINYEQYGAAVMAEVFEKGSNYGRENIGHGEHYVVDLSSPNIAKPMSVGHLRSTIIGNAIARALESQGFNVTKDNHLGDWGTQFGYLMFAIRKYDALEAIRNSDDPITTLKDLYVEITKEKETDPSVAENARAWFAKLEQGDPEARELWEEISVWSLAEFQKVYKRLNVDFDTWLGESFYEPMLNGAVQEAIDRGVAVRSEGAIIIDLRNNLNQIVYRWGDELADLLLAAQENQVDLSQLPLLGSPSLESLYHSSLARKSDEAVVSEKVRIKKELMDGKTKVKQQALVVLQKIWREVSQDSGRAVDMNKALSLFFEIPISTNDSLDIMTRPINVETENAFEGEDLGVQVIRKSDGTSTYMTRDMATALYRGNQLQADGIVYVVGGEQQLYFKQLFEIMSRMGYDIGKSSRHVWFGMVKGIKINPDTGENMVDLGTGKVQTEKMSTRKGTTVLLSKVLDEATKRAGELMTSQVSKTKLTVPERGELAEQLGVGALMWNDLMSGPHREIMFDYDKMLSMQGNSAPYVMYARARALSILEQSGSLETPNLERVTIDHQLEQSLVKKIAEFPQAITRVVTDFDPSYLPTYLFELSQIFNSFYHELSILKADSDEAKTTRLALCKAVAQTLENGLKVLNIPAPDRM